MQSTTTLFLEKTPLNNQSPIEGSDFAMNAKNENAPHSA